MEIKTPQTSVCKAPYQRGVSKPSNALMGAIVHVLDQPWKFVLSLPLHKQSSRGLPT
ncbi:hypothetical protein HFN63_33090 [Rhizobium leguminosarum]|uniref:DUF4263 domain-containing protein n=1 Tax=Rhizobium leguminosarum TaxID=384 RepID=UPI001C943DFB|nr:DUF4263 domain-containing protein [Rhizobium leguminosarum]MBY5774866.1 hypothetical protein [Rhizobium leguminosarum]